MPDPRVVARRRRRKVVAAVTVATVVGTGTVLLVGATDASPPAVGGAAAAFLPADGAVDWVETATGEVQREQRRSPGVTPLFAFPTSLTSVAMSAYGDDARSVPHWVTYWGPAVGRDGGIPRDLYSITDAGIRLVAGAGYPLDSVFVPGILVLPADVRAGAEWTTEGASLLAQAGANGPESAEFAYVGEYSAQEPEDPALLPFAEQGCLQVDSSLTLTPGDDDPLVVLETALWCPGRGLVASTSQFEGEESVSTLPVPQPRVDVGSGATAASVDWSGASDWSAEVMTARWDDDVWEDTPFSISPALEPVVVGDRLAIPDVNTGDLTLLMEDREGLVVAQPLRPGGDVTALASVDGLVIAATSQRDLVAYTADGERLWTRDTADIVVAPPVSDGADGLLVAGVDGTVRLVDLRTGEERWSAGVSGDALETLIVTGDRVVAGDRIGGVFALSVADGSEVWTAADPSKVDVLATGGDALYLGRGDQVLRIDAESGDIVWSTNVRTGLDDVLVVGDRVVVQTWRDLLGLDPESGSIVWRSPGATDMATDGAVLIAHDGRTLRLLDGNGADVATWPVEPESLGASRYMTSAPDAVWLVDTVSDTVRLGP